MSGAPLTPITVFAAGVLSFLSPCVLPLVPGYVSLISGTSAADAESNTQRPMLGRVMLNSLLFVLGFSIVFILLGATATTIGELTRQYKRELSWIAGIVIIIFGLHLTGLLKIKYL